MVPLLIEREAALFDFHVLVVCKSQNEDTATRRALKFSGKEKPRGQGVS